MAGTFLFHPTPKSNLQPIKLSTHDGGIKESKIGMFKMRNVIIIIIIIIYLLTATGLSPGGSGYFTCKQNIKLVTTGFKSGGLHEKHVVATWNVGNRLSVCL